MKDYGYYLDRATQKTGPVKVVSGGSGYFSTPSPILDPHLFDGTHLKTSVRTQITNTLYDFWARKYSNAHSWSTVWLAGSGISYQWAASRGNGDLDVLVGVAWPAFIAANRAYGGLTPQQIANEMDLELKTELWPRTAHTVHNGQIYEQTYFVNSGGSDIRNINPYAAYNLTTDTWTIRPPALPTNPETLYPKAYSNAVAAESRTISGLVDRYNSLSAQAGSSHGPGRVNANTALHQLTQQAQAMWDDIHHGRRAAFAPGGLGYSDWHNYRWQAHKRSGTAQALAAISASAQAADTAWNDHLYGVQLDTADKLIARAIFSSRGRR